MKKVIKIFLLSLLVLVSLALLTVGPLYKIQVDQVQIQESEESEPITKEIVLGDWVLDKVKLNTLENNFYLQTCSGVVSGIGLCSFVFILTLKKKKKNRKSNNYQPKIKEDGSLKVKFPNPESQNQHKKNNITF